MEDSSVLQIKTLFKIGGKIVQIGHNKILGLTGAAAFFAVLIVAAPAAMIAPLIKGIAPGISYRSIDGTVWNARISGLRVEGVDLGNISAGINLRRLFTAVLSYNIAIEGQAVNGQAQFARSLLGGVEIRDADFIISRALLRRYALLSVPIDGSATISGATIVANNEGCVSAEGIVRTEALSSVAKQFGMGAFHLEGPLSCADGRMSMQFAGMQRDVGAISITLTELTDQRYRMAVIIDTTDAALKQALQLAGFEGDGDSITYEEIAKWIDPPREAVEIRDDKQVDSGV